jgi:hypothetical protein
MLSERDIELARPDAFDFVWGNLPAAKRAEFNRHLGGCRYCQAVVDEYSEIGRIIKDLPPPVEPSADLEPRTIAAMVAALAEQRATTDRRSDAEDQAATRVHPIPNPSLRLRPRPGFPHHLRTNQRRSNRKPAPWSPACLYGDVTSSPRRCRCRRLHHHHSRHRHPTQPWREPDRPGHSRDPAPCHRCGQGDWRRSSHRPGNGPTGCLRQLGYHPARARPQELRGLTVVRMLVRDPQHQQVASAGSFLVPDGGSGTFSMTSAVDPHDFPTMEVTIGPPNRNGALGGTVVLSGQKL